MLSNNLFIWIAQHPVETVVGIIILIAIVNFILLNRKDILSRAALYAVSKAEEAWGSKTGQIKFAEVYSYLNKQYPIITFFLSESKLTEIIELALNQMKWILEAKEQAELK